MKLKVGDRAPDFSAEDQNDKTHHLSDYRGGWLLLYFYPRDFTSGCTQEACAFRDVYVEFRRRGMLLGVSADNKKSHQSFAQKYSLPYPLLADTTRKIIKAYGADGIIFPKRVSFIIDPRGMIQKIYEEVTPDTHPTEILKDIKEIYP